VYQQQEQEQEQEQQQQDAENPFLDPPFSRIKKCEIVTLRKIPFKTICYMAIFRKIAENRKFVKN
jgi:hypothetical protein